MIDDDDFSDHSFEDKNADLEDNDYEMISKQVELR